MFGYGMDRKTINIILAVLFAMSLARMNRTDLLITLLTLPGVVIAITFHEFAHAFAADKLGDYTPKSQGRLTLNPLKHIDPVGFVLLIFANVGWGKPVQINPNNFTSNKSKGECEAIVALAGPLMNFFIAIVLAFVGAIFDLSYIDDLIYITIATNIGLGVFNLIPLPPLDGEKIFRHILPYNALEWLDRNEQTLYLIFMLLWITGTLRYLVNPVIQAVETGIFWTVSHIVSIFL